MLRDVLEVVLTLSRCLGILVGEPTILGLTDQAAVIILCALVAPESAISGGETATNLADIVAVESHFKVRLLT